MTTERGGGTSALRHAVLVNKRPSLTRDLPHGPSDLQWVTNTATLVYGEREAVLIDTFTTIAQNAELVEWVSSFDRTLTHVYVTHGHGDHFFGLRALQRRFPEARAVATGGTVAQARRHAAPALRAGFWDRLFPGEIPDELSVPGMFGGPLEVEGNRLEVIETGFTDTHDTTSVWVPSLRLLVAGDVVYNHAHPYLAETDTETRANWRDALERLQRLDPAVVVAGHKHVDHPDAAGDIAATIAYLEDFERLLAGADSVIGLYDALLALYPDRANPGSAWAAAKAFGPGDS